MTDLEATASGIATKHYQAWASGQADSPTEDRELLANDIAQALAAEREACAKVADECAASAAWQASDAGAMNNRKGAEIASAENRMASGIAAAIRARNKPEGGRRE